MKDFERYVFGFLLAIVIAAFSILAILIKDLRPREPITVPQSERGLASNFMYVKR